MSTNGLETIDDTVATVDHRTGEQTPKFGLGSGTALSGVIGAWVLAITAAVDAGGGFYTDNGVVTLIIAAAGSTLAFLGLRLPRVQFGVNKAREVHDVIDARLNELTGVYEAKLEEYRQLIEEIEGGQDTPDELKDEVVTVDPGDERTDTMAPPA